jgi:hypothetical protein
LVYRVCGDNLQVISNDMAEHNRHAATVRILLETLEEQGVLRALLDHTRDSQGVERQAQTYSVDMNLRYQGALTELEKTVQKVCMIVYWLVLVPIFVC